MIKCPKEKFKVEKYLGFIKNCGEFDSVTTFWDDKCKVEAVYYHLKGKCNYLSSWGFPKGGIDERRKVKSCKVKLPFYSMDKGWYGYEGAK